MSPASEPESPLERRDAGGGRRGVTRPPLWLAILYPLLGYLAIWLPWTLMVSSGRAASQNPVDGFQPVSLVLLLGVGLLGGFAAPRVAAWWAVLTVAALPVIVFAEMARDPTSHNLFPFEFVFYGVLSLVAVLGAALAKAFLRRRAGKAP
jgi:hypothetical protein